MLSASYTGATFVVTKQKASREYDDTARDFSKVTTLLKISVMNKRRSRTRESDGGSSNIFLTVASFRRACLLYKYRDDDLR